MKPAKTSCLFLDIGGVLLSDGWGHVSRKMAAAKFKLDLTDFEYRHQLNFSVYEEGKISLREYLDRVVFHQKRTFSQAQFQKFMFLRSQPDLLMLELVRALKEKYRLKIIAVSNEGREMNAFRIRKFKLDEFVDAFVSSCYVHLRKPDVDIFRLALDIAQVSPQKILYIEDTPMFVEIARSLGVRGLWHTNYKSTMSQLSALGFEMNGAER